MIDVIFLFPIVVPTFNLQQSYGSAIGQQRNVEYLLGHFGHSLESLFMLHVILLKLDHLIGGLLSEEFNGNALIVKRNLALLSHGFTGH